jgi:hypothetical protein
VIAAGEQAIQAKSVRVEGLPDIDGAVCPQGVERERAQAGELARLSPDAAGILAESAVADIVVAVLDTPMAPDGMCENRGTEADLAGIVGDLLPRGPQAGAGVLYPGQARNAADAGDVRAPFGREVWNVVNIEYLGEAVLLPAVAVPVYTRMAIDWPLCIAQRCQCIMQARLVALDADEQSVASGGGSFKAPF